MNREDYRKAFDELSFSADFQARTEALLRQRARELEKEEPTMQFKRTKKMAVLIAAAVTLLAVSVSAAVLLLKPAEVAERFEDPVLAAAFESGDAVLVNETVRSGDYTITLGGLVSGEGLRKWCDEAESSRTYAVVSIARADGTPLTEDDNMLGTGTFVISPLVAGYAPHAVNAWTLGGGCGSFLENGVTYYLLDTLDIQMFADHTVYMAVYQGFVPSYDMFSVAEDGAYSLREGVTGALFTLPLDVSLADPAAAQAFVESTGLVYEPMTDEERAALEETEEPVVTTTEKDGEKRIAIGGSAARTDGELEPFTAETFKDYLATETGKLKQQLADGILSQETYDKTVAELEETLAGLEDGTLVAYLDGENSLVVGTASNGGYNFQYGKTEDGAASITITDGD